MKELKDQTNITMEEKLEKLIMQFQKMRISHIRLIDVSLNEVTAAYHQGQAKAFSMSAQLLTDILNSENPNSVSNQPTEE